MTSIDKVIHEQLANLSHSEILQVKKLIESTKLVNPKECSLIFQAVKETTLMLIEKELAKKEIE